VKAVRTAARKKRETDFIRKLRFEADLSFRGAFAPKALCKIVDSLRSPGGNAKPICIQDFLLKKNSVTSAVSAAMF